MTQAVLEHNCLEVLGAEVSDLRLRPASDCAPEGLRQALAQCLDVEPDPRRPGFYEASIDGRRYYFHVVPGRRPARVLLLARW